MQPRQARIFVLSTDALDNWAETILGKVVQPIVCKYGNAFSWFWFSQYSCSTEDLGDCDFAAIPGSFKSPDGSHRSIRFRYAMDPALTPQFESELTTKVTEHGYHLSGCLDYDSVADLGGDRFIGNEHRTATERAKRAELVAKAFEALSRIVLHALVAPDTTGRYRIESNDNTQNPKGSSFESLHHMFCNITSPPLQAILYQAPDHAQRFFLGTAWSTRPSDMVAVAKLPIRF